MDKITPAYLNQFVNFHFTDANWKYDNNAEPDIAKLQTEGAAKIFNLLVEHKIALLADEVGMGKTYEGLAAMVMLWRQKPNAKVLLYAPNELVAHKWINDYNNFIEKNYREGDDLVKSSLNNQSLRKAIYCHNQIDLMEKAAWQWPSLFVCKTSSLSGFLSPKWDYDTFKRLNLDFERTVNDDSSDEEKAEWMYNLAMKCNEKLYAQLSNNNEPPFDLILFDEAHYLRRTEQGAKSNRSIVAHAFFSGRNIRVENAYDQYIPLAKRTLLLTATPNHSSNKDVLNIVKLFNPDFKNYSPEDILKTICLRRFRRLAGKTKHQYRKEIPDEVEMKSLREQLFFAAYQKSLVESQAAKIRSGEAKGNNPYRILFGYLEGFEFLTQEKERPEPKENDKDGNTDIKRDDFREADDTKLINELSKKYFDVYYEAPAHPKYEEIIKDLSPLNEKELTKKLVFVRRIPSIYEITRRLTEEYDKMFLSYFSELSDYEIIEQNYNRNLRAYFQKNEEELDEEEVSVEVENIDESDRIPTSKVYDLFTIKKSGDYRATEASNFRLRFTKDTQIFSMFFQPAMDYKSARYTIKSFAMKSEKSSDKRLYKDTIGYLRYQQIKDPKHKMKLESYYNYDEPKSQVDKIKVKTLLGLWYDQNVKDRIMKKNHVKALKQYDDFTYIEKEAFSEYLETGVLFSSEYIVRFFAFYKKYQEQYKGIDLYQKFCTYVQQTLEGNGLLKLIDKAVLTFKNFYKKELALNEERLLQFEWRFLKSTLPVYPYSGETQRQSIIRAFNSPFYPNALIATSVLQEGVDLHYHCSEVIHYGIAWTPGDNEQRIGRVDRLFGKLNNDLADMPETRLPIHYPYLKDTIDQDQMERFIRRKHESEKLLDQFKMIEVSKEVNLKETSEKDWKTYFNSPTDNSVISEPYGVNKDDFNSVVAPQKYKVHHELNKKSIEKILNTLYAEFKDELVYYHFNKSDERGTSVAGLKHIRKEEKYEGRNQPVFIDLEYYEQGQYYIGKHTYALVLKTPILFKKRLNRALLDNDIIKVDYVNNPMLKICAHAGEIKKKIERLNIVTELPIFMVDDENINISSDELITAIYNLISFADRLEYDLNGEGEEVKNDFSEEEPFEQNGELLTANRKPKEINSNWLSTMDKKYIYQTFASEVNEPLSAFEFNYYNKFVRKVSINDTIQKQVATYYEDALDEEMKFLEKVIKE
jgi:hypothetical protein